MTKCVTCGAPVNLAPDGDPSYEPPLWKNAQNIRKAENAAYERAAKVAEGYALGEDALVKAARRNMDHRNAAIHGYAGGEFQAMDIAIRALKHRATE